MDLILKILGGLFLAFLGLIAILFLGLKLLKRKLLKVLEQAGKQAQAGWVPPRIHLQREEEVEWSDSERVEGLAREIRQQGFTDVGSFTVEELTVLRVQSFVNTGDGAIAVIYDHDLGGIWIDYVTRYEDGEGWTHSTATSGHAVESPPGQHKAYDTEASAAELYRRHLAERRSDGILTVTAADFQRVFEEAYAKDMDWRNSRGGPSEEEIRRELEASGEEVTDEQVARVREIQRAQAISNLEMVLGERFLKETTMSAARWEEVEDRLVYIFDLLPGSMVAERAYEGAGMDEEEPDEFALPPDLADLPAREAFARLNERLPEGRRFEKVGELAEPVQADVYVAPEYEGG